MASDTSILIAFGPDTADGGWDPVPAEAKADRSRRLRALSDRQGARHRHALRGTRQRVLVESNGRGYAADYTRFEADGAPGEMVEVIA